MYSETGPAVHLPLSRSSKEILICGIDSSCRRACWHWPRCLLPTSRSLRPPSRHPRATIRRAPPDGHPDLQGTYDLATITPMERPAGTQAGAHQGRGAQARNRPGRAAGTSGSSPSMAIGRRRPRAATDRRARPATSAGTTPAGSIRVPPTPSWTGRSARR